MKKIIVTFAALVALAVPASSSAVGHARWVMYPTCAATTTTITCTGRAAGVQPESMESMGVFPVKVAIHAAVHYTCNSDPPFVWVSSGSPLHSGYDAPINIQVAAAFQNGRVFSLEFTPPSAPSGISPTVACLFAGGSYTRDPNYYNVDVRIGWGFGDFAPIEALEAPIGTVSPG